MMNIDKLREAWLQDNPKIFCFSNIFNFVQFGEKVLSKQFFSLQMHHHMKWDIIMEIK